MERGEKLNWNKVKSQVEEEESHVKNCRLKERVKIE